MSSGKSTPEPPELSPVINLWRIQEHFRLLKLRNQSERCKYISKILDIIKIDNKVWVKIDSWVYHAYIETQYYRLSILSDEEPPFPTLHIIDSDGCFIQALPEELHQLQLVHYCPFLHGFRADNGILATTKVYTILPDTEIYQRSLKSKLDEYLPSLPCVLFDSILEFCVEPVEDLTCLANILSE
jgi:hypothetical protein